MLTPKAGWALLGMFTVSCTTSTAHEFVASKLHASGANGDAEHACRTIFPFVASTHLVTRSALAVVLPLDGFASQHITRASAAG